MPINCLTMYYHLKHLPCCMRPTSISSWLAGGVVLIIMYCNALYCIFDTDMFLCIYFVIIPELPPLLRIVNKPLPIL